MRRPGETAATPIDVAAAGLTAVGPEESADRSSWQHVASLEGLRRCAVAAVLLFHAGYLQGGFLGVDLFFVLSGFLITSLLLADATTAGIGLGAFWGAGPAGCCRPSSPCSSVVSLSACLRLPGRARRVRRDGPWALFYVANWHFIAEASGYWESFASRRCSTTCGAWRSRSSSTCCGRWCSSAIWR